MWRLQGPAGLQVRLVGGGLCGDWGNFLLCSALLPPYAGVALGLLSGGHGRVPLLPDLTPVASPALFPTLTPLHIGSKPSSV